MRGNTNKKVATAEFLSVEIFCSNLNKEVKIKKENFNISSSESECELCGSHGDVTLEIFTCECGKSHEIEIKSW